MKKRKQYLKHIKMIEFLVLNEKDVSKCRICNLSREDQIKEYGRDLSIHHINGNIKDNSITNLAIICSECHRAIHGCKKLTNGGEKTRFKTGFNKGKTLEELYGEEKAKEMKEEMRKRQLGNNYCLGIIRSTEYCKNMSQILTGRIRTKEHAQNISLAKKGKPQSEESNQKRRETMKIRLQNNPSELERLKNQSKQIAENR